MLCSIWTKPRSAHAWAAGTPARRDLDARRLATTDRAAARVLWVVGRGKSARFEFISRTRDGKEVK
jgi:hypothetical protein